MSQDSSSHYSDQEEVVSRLKEEKRLISRNQKNKKKEKACRSVGLRESRDVDGQRQSDVESRSNHGGESVNGQRIGDDAVSSGTENSTDSDTDRKPEYGFKHGFVAFEGKPQIVKYLIVPKSCRDEMVMLSMACTAWNISLPNLVVDLNGGRCSDKQSLAVQACASFVTTRQASNIHGTESNLSPQESVRFGKAHTETTDDEVKHILVGVAGGCAECGAWVWSHSDFETGENCGNDNGNMGRQFASARSVTQDGDRVVQIGGHVFTKNFWKLKEFRDRAVKIGSKEAPKKVTYNNKKATYTFKEKMGVVCDDDGIVQEVHRDTQAEKIGVQKGDRVLKIQQIPQEQADVSSQKKVKDIPIQKRLKDAEDSKKTYDVTVRFNQSPSHKLQEHCTHILFFDQGCQLNGECFLSALQRVVPVAYLLVGGKFTQSWWMSFSSACRNSTAIVLNNTGEAANKVAKAIKQRRREYFDDIAHNTEPNLGLPPGNYSNYVILDAKHHATDDVVDILIQCMTMVEDKETHTLGFAKLERDRLYHAWELYILCEKCARHWKLTSDLIEYTVIAIGLVSTVGAIMNLRFIVVCLPVLTGLTLAAGAYLNPTQKWRQFVIASARIIAEIYLYRARVGEYMSQLLSKEARLSQVIGDRCQNQPSPSIATSTRNASQHYHRDAKETNATRSKTRSGIFAETLNEIQSALLNSEAAGTDMGKLAPDAVEKHIKRNLQGHRKYALKKETHVFQPDEIWGLTMSEDGVVQESRHNRNNQGISKGDRIVKVTAGWRTIMSFSTNREGHRRLAFHPDPERIVAERIGCGVWKITSSKHKCKVTFKVSSDVKPSTYYKEKAMSVHERRRTTTMGTNNKQETYTFNGDMGIDSDEDGIVQEVMCNGQAHEKGIQAGYQIINIDNLEFTKERLRQKQTSGSDYHVTVDVHSGQSDCLMETDKWITNMKVDDGFSPVSAEAYMEFRMQPARDRYDEISPGLARKASWLQCIIFLSTAANGFLTLSGRLHWVPASVAVHTAISAVLQYSRLNSRINDLSSAKLALANLSNWWQSLSLVERRLVETKRYLIEACEDAINMETSWVRLMRKKPTTNQSNEAEAI